MASSLRSASLVLSIGLIAFLLWRFGLGDLVVAFQRLSPEDLVVYLALTVAVVFVYAARWQLVTRSLGRRVGLLRLASVRLAGDAVGNLVPSARLAGDPVRAAILHAGGVGGTVSSAAVALDRLLETITNVFCGLLYVSVFSLTHTAGTERRSLLILGVSLALGAAALTVPLVLLRRGSRPLWPLYALLGSRRGRATKWIAAVRSTEDHLLEFFHERPVAFVWGLLLSLLAEGLTVVQYFFLLRAFGVAVDIPTLLLILVGTGVAHAMPAPAALGTLEGTEVAVLSAAAGDPSLGFVIGLILRLHETVLSLAGLIALSAHGLSLTRLPALRLPKEASAG